MHRSAPCAQRRSRGSCAGPGWGPVRWGGAGRNVIRDAHAEALAEPAREVLAREPRVAVHVELRERARDALGELFAQPLAERAVERGARLQRLRLDAVPVPTRRVQLVRRDGRGVSTLYGRGGMRYRAMKSWYLMKPSPFLRRHRCAQRRVHRTGDTRLRHPEPPLHASNLPQEGCRISLSLSLSLSLALSLSLSPPPPSAPSLPVPVPVPVPPSLPPSLPPFTS